MEPIILTVIYKQDSREVGVEPGDTYGDCVGYAKTQLGLGLPRNWEKTTYIEGGIRYGTGITQSTTITILDGALPQA